MDKHHHSSKVGTISHRKPGDAPIYYLDKPDLQNLKPDLLVIRLKAQQYAKLAFRDVTDRTAMAAGI